MLTVGIQKITTDASVVAWEGDLVINSIPQWRGVTEIHLSTPTYVVWPPNLQSHNELIEHVTRSARGSKLQVMRILCGFSQPVHDLAWKWDYDIYSKTIQAGPHHYIPLIDHDYIADDPGVLYDMRRSEGGIWACRNMPEPEVKEQSPYTMYMIDPHEPQPQGDH
jgi:hypothetical protein